MWSEDRPHNRRVSSGYASSPVHPGRGRPRAVGPGVSGVLEATRPIDAPMIWERYLGLVLDGLRAQRAHPLPGGAMAPGQVEKAMMTLAAERARCGE